MIVFVSSSPNPYCANKGGCYEWLSCIPYDDNGYENSLACDFFSTGYEVPKPSAQPQLGAFSVSYNLILSPFDKGCLCAD